MRTYRCALKDAMVTNQKADTYCRPMGCVNLVYCDGLQIGDDELEQLRASIRGALKRFTGQRGWRRQMTDQERYREAEERILALVRGKIRSLRLRVEYLQRTRGNI